MKINSNHLYQFKNVKVNSAFEKDGVKIKETARKKEKKFQ